MSAFKIDKALHLIHDKAGWDRLAASTSEQHHLADLSVEQRRALLEGDIASLYNMGVNAYLLLKYSAWIGVPAPELTKLLQAHTAGQSVDQGVG